MTTASGAGPLAYCEPALARSVTEGLARVEARLAGLLSSDDAFLREASGHLFEAGGKRFRPLLALLAAHLGTGATDEVVSASAAVELIHLASLYHDDVMDVAEMRRGVPSANALYGNSTAILVGDLLFGTASAVVADLGPHAVKIQAEAFVRLCAGQIRDARPRPFGADPIEYYLATLADKTGSLIATATRYGAMFSGCPPEVVETMRLYGERIGIAFQLADDLLDITSSVSGKPSGIDLRAGVETLPVLYVKASQDPADARLIALLDADLGRDERAHAEALELLTGHPALERARAYTHEVARSAQELLDPLPPSAARDALRGLADGVVERSR